MESGSIYIDFVKRSDFFMLWFFRKQFTRNYYYRYVMWEKVDDRIRIIDFSALVPPVSVVILLPLPRLTMKSSRFHDADLLVCFFLGFRK